MKNLEWPDYPGILFDLSAATTEAGDVKVTLGATGPRRRCSPWQVEFEIWAKGYELESQSEPDIGQKGIRRREVSVVLDAKSLLELILIDIGKYNDETMELKRDAELLAEERRERKSKLHPSDIYANPQKFNS